MRAEGCSDSLAVGLRQGRDNVVQVWWDRRCGTFSERDLAVLRMIAPAVHRLVRDSATPCLPASLTVQERRIAELARSGLSNSEIGTRLFLSPRTVEWHLHHVFAKLGVGSRHDLRDALHASDPAVRWWAVMGHLMHGKPAVTAAVVQASHQLTARGE